MSTPESHPPPMSKEVESAAADWLARHDAGLSDAEQTRFVQWLAQDVRHAAAWREMHEAWQAFDRAGQDGLAPPMMRELARRQRRRQTRKRTLAVTVLVSTAAIAAILFLHPAAGIPAGNDAAVRLAGTDSFLKKPERRVLPDASVVELGDGAEIAVDFSPATRNVRLLRGDAHFAVTKNPARPFVVSAAGSEVRAVGTAFAVGLRANSVDVIVTEARVSVDQPASRASSPAPVLVDAGSLLVVPSGTGRGEPLRAQPLPAAEIERRLAWRAPRLELAGMPLARVVAALNRENRVQLAIGERAIAGMRISGVFRADNAEGFARLLETNYGIRTEHRGDGVIVLSRKP